VSIGGVSLAGCSDVFGNAGDDTIKIGAALPLSGALDLYGQEGQHGFGYAEEVLGGEILGQEYEIIVEDTQTEPGAGVEAVESLVERENVDAMVGLSSSAVVSSVAPYLRNEAQLPFIVLQGSSPTIREDSENCSQFWFFPWTSSRQQGIAHTRFIDETLPEEEPDIDNSSVHFIYFDYQAGQEALQYFTEEYESVGGEVTETTATPPGESDFATYMPELSDSDPDIIHAFVPGNSAIQLVNQAEEFGLIDEKTLCFSGDILAQVQLAQMGAAADGIYGTHWYDHTRDAEMNRGFVEWYESEYDLPANDAAANGFNQIYSLAQGMETAGSTDPDEVVDALAGMSFDSPMGELTYRASDHQSEQNYLGFRVQDGEYESLSRYPDVIGPSECDL
jgi:branched-chain amino acid transport system substrate-binding protein